MVACALYSCHAYHRMEAFSDLANPPTQRTSARGIQPDQAGRSALKKEPTAAVVYLHGLSMDHNEVSYCAEKVKEAFGDQVFNILPTCRERTPSENLSIPKQAEAVIEEIKQTLRDAFPTWTEQEIEAFPIHLIGYSQGGVLICYIAHIIDNTRPATGGHTLNIKTITPVHAPLSGVELLDQSCMATSKFKRDVKPYLDRTSYNTQSFYHRCMPFLLPMIHIANKVGIKRGIKAIRTDSDTITEARNFIRNGNHNIPIYIIAGAIGPTSEYFAPNQGNTDESSKASFNEACSSLITQDKKGTHDLLVSTRSQLARTNSYTNLASSVNDPVYPKNVEIYIDRNVHAYNFLPLPDLVFKEESGQMALHHDPTINKIIAFLAKHSDFPDNPT